MDLPAGRNRAPGNSFLCIYALEGADRGGIAMGRPLLKLGLQSPIGGHEMFLVIFNTLSKWFSHILVGNLSC